MIDMNTTTTTTKKMITITMSERGPVKIDPEQWPVIASAEEHDGQVECQANTLWRIKVREHADGRRLVYGWQDRGNGGQHAGYRGTYAGFLLDQFQADHEHREAELEAATIRAIRRVAGVIGAEHLGAECIADLPAREI